MICSEIDLKSNETDLKNNITRSRRIGIDIDGVIRDIYTPLISYIKTFHPKIKIDSMWTDYKIWNHFKINGRPVNEHWFKMIWFDRAAEFIYKTSAKPYPYVQEALKCLKSKGHKIILISAQPNIRCMTYTLQWLEKYNIPFNEVHFVDYDYKHLVKCNLYIDDSPKQIELLSRTSHRYVWLYEQPWNKDIITVHKFNNWRNFPIMVERIFQ